VPLRPAREDDLDEIIALIGELADYEKLRNEVTLERDAVREHLFGDHPVASVTLATDDSGAVVGFALWFPTYSTFLGKAGIWLEDLFVRPAHRKQGYGRALIEDLRARTDGRVEWAVLDWNRSAIDFYDSLGARPVSGWTIYRWLPTSDAS
jgi:GNAT superfamily N-acetyltransferase